MFSLQLYNRSTLFELKIRMLLNVSQKHQMISVPKRDQIQAVTTERWHLENQNQKE